ncbi:UDP-N-acetylglucosamine--LPS N-acetylglucosamine transferase [Gorillibacterium massiliense]|uniref:UDP-N-acetylglucosamine--LPS N-acetylglucosamine transferase n=1 Tax=Gorillibacterium massiliense TaxID=1280390 RepID=UPI000594239B|nr:UDP-N-acetylglucosamine--LPS N-acetylglucosamine transferase [Gorillibacterium massiliense]
MRKKRVLLLSEGFGTGHTQAAHAISIGLRRHSSMVRTRVMELGAFQHPTIAPLIYSAYRKTLISQPKLYAKLYKHQYNKSLNPIASMALHRIFYNSTEEIIRQLKPDVIVCTHPFPSKVVSRLKRSGLTTPLCTVITDYDAHGTWVDTGVNKYLVSTDDVREKLIEKGIAPEVIQVTGIPVHPDFYGQSDKAAIRTQFQLKEMPTVLFMGGGWGLINNEELMFHANQYREQVQLIYCLGSNEKHLQKLMEDPRMQHPNIRLLGYTRDIGKLMEVSDILVTKPGGMTCTEGMAKGIPMLFYAPLPGQEEENLHYFVGNGHGEAIKDLETIDDWFQKLIEEYPEFVNNRNLLLKERSKINPDICSEAIIDFINSTEITAQ